MRRSPKTLWGEAGNPAGAQTEVRRKVTAGMTTPRLTPQASTESSMNRDYVRAVDRSTRRIRAIILPTEF